MLAEEELTFPFERFNEFRDLEMPGRFVQLDPRAVRAAYLDRVRRFVRRVEMACGQMNIDYVPLSTKWDFDVALAGYLAQRQATTR